MGYWYEFYDPEHDLKLVDEGKFAGMPFYDCNFPVAIPMAFGDVGYYSHPDYSDPYNCTGLISRKLAIEMQKHMKSNNTIFTDMMDKHHTNTLIFRIT